MIGTAHVIQADARQLPLADDSVDLIVTSPPYFALRSYQDGGEHYAGQLGSEATPAEFVDALLEVTAECVRVLKPSGSLWVNLGDKYAERGGPERAPFEDGGQVVYRQSRPRRRSERETGIRQKSLMGIPWRYALRCIDDLGLILRAEVIWSKPNGLPESVTDRVRRSHEQWFHLTLQPRYFSAVDEIREPHKYPRTPAEMASRMKGIKNGVIHGSNRGANRGDDANSDEMLSDATGSNPLGKLPGSVWTIPTEPLQVPERLGVDHFAAYPTEWPRRIIAGWSPTGVCVECGEGRRPVVSSVKITSRPGGNVYDQRMPGRHASGNQGREGRAGDYRVALEGYACGCAGEIRGDLQVVKGFPARSAPPTTPSVVLDPFGGTGTTALVAKALGRHGISIDMSADYTRLAQWRVDDPDQLAKAARVAKPPREADGQLGFDLEGIA